MCYLVFNLDHHPQKFVFQVRAKVDGVWNRKCPTCPSTHSYMHPAGWKTAGRLSVSEPQEVKENCCIVPPPYIVTNIGAPGTWWEVNVAPAATEQNVT